MSLLRRTFTLDESLVILGVQGSHDTLCIDFDLRPWTDELGADGNATINAKRSCDTVFQPVEGTTYEDGILSWVVQAYDTEAAGFGKIQIDYTTGTSGLVRSAIVKTYTQANIGGTEAAPADFQNWYDRLLELYNGTLSASESASADAELASEKSDIAVESANTASEKAEIAVQASETAVGASDNATQKAQIATDKASEASGYAADAEQAKDDAVTAKNDAVGAKDDAVIAKEASETAQGKAEEAQRKAEEAAASITLSATDDGNGNVTLTA